MGWILIGLLVAVVAVVVVAAIHRLALWADARGWIFYKTKPRFRGSSLGLIEEIYHPAHEHVIDEEKSEQERADVDESGEARPPSDGE